MDWTLAQIETKYRQLTGMPDANQLAQATAWSEINDYYQRFFPVDSQLDDFKEIAASIISTTASDSGQYSVAETVLAVEEPITLFDASANYLCELTFYRDQQLFFADYPRDPDADTAQPGGLLWFGRNFFLRPIANAVFTVDMAVVRKPATALTASGNTPLREDWGEAIAHGAALRKLTDLGDETGIARVAGGLNYYMSILTTQDIVRNKGTRVVPGW